MAQVCKKHQDKPERIYHQCIGCELEWYQRRVQELEEKLSTTIQSRLVEEAPQ